MSSNNFDFKSTKELKLPEKLVDQIISQDPAVKIIKKAAQQKRHVLLIGSPGTGKSLISQALAELLPSQKLRDILSFHNPNDENNPLVKTVSAGKGRILINKFRMKAAGSFKNQNFIFFIILIIAVLSPWYVRAHYGDIMGAASLIGSMGFFAAFVIFLNLGKKMKTLGSGAAIPKLLVDNTKTKTAPFVDASGAPATALLGNVLHDPLQSGGLGTPAYERLIPGLIHRANGGVLHIDEIASMPLATQQKILTALQEKKFPITGQHEQSSGASVVSTPAPSDFILVASGNLDTLQHLHPALRSRIRGYGYEVYMDEVMDDTPENQFRIANFIAQEVAKDGKIPHFKQEAVQEILVQARRMAGRSGKLTLKLRDLGGLIRAAGDVAVENNKTLVSKKHVIDSKVSARYLEEQIADKYIEQKKDYDIILTKGNRVGRVNGLAVIGEPPQSSGIMLPIESEVTPGGKKAEFVATGKLGKIAKEAVQNVSAIIMKFFGEDIQGKYDIYTQFLQTAGTGVEGDSASIAVATSIISALKSIPVDQSVAMTGSLSVRGEILAVGGVSSKVEAAIDAGIKTIIVPEVNKLDIIIPLDKQSKVKIVYAKRIEDVLEHALVWDAKTKPLLKNMKNKAS